MNPPTIAERVAVCRAHLEKSVAWKGPRTGIFEMRRHYSNYFKGVDHFKDFRMKLVSVATIEEVNELLDEVNERYNTEMA